MNGIFPCRAVVEMLRDPWWDMFNTGPPAPRGWIYVVHVRGDIFDFV